MISRKFIKSSFIYTLAGALPMASAFILLPFYISLLPTAVYGALSLYLAFSLFVQVLVAYSFDSSLYIHYHEFKSEPSKLSSFVSTAFIFMLIIGVVVGAILTLLGDFLFGIVFSDERISFYPFGLLSVAIGIFQALFKVYSNLMQSREKPETFLWSNLVLFALIAGLTVAGLYIYPSTLIGPIVGRVIAGLILSVWVFYRVNREFGFHFDFAFLKTTFSFNNYLFIYQLQQWAINYLDRFLMVLFLPIAEIGIYDFAIKCLVVIEYIMTGLNSSFFPKVVSTIVAQETKKSTIELNRYYNGLTAVVMLMISIGILILPMLVTWIDTKQGYQESIQYFPYIAILYLLKSMKLYFASPYAALKFTKPLPVFYLIVSLLKIAGLFLLIRSYGVYGVVASSLIASVGEVLLLRLGISGKFIFQFNVFKLLIAPAVLLVAVLALEPAVAKTLPLLVHSFYVLLVIVFLTWVYWNELKALGLSKILKT